MHVLISLFYITIHKNKPPPNLSNTTTYISINNAPNLSNTIYLVNIANKICLVNVN